MSLDKTQQGDTRLHPRNKNREQYDLSALTSVNSELKLFIIPNKLGFDSIDFSNPIAVKLLNKAILNHYYGIKNWDFPDKNLCPPIPGRADYIHHMADILNESNAGITPIGNKITCLDIGVGANCIYPIIGVVEYNWKFIGSDIDPTSITSAQQIINSNLMLKNKIRCKLQKDPAAIFQDILNQKDKVDLTICNPPFHASIEDAQEGSLRKIKNLTGGKAQPPKLNFAGISNELICDGGEYQFIQHMIRESKEFSKNCFWFTTLVSKSSNLQGIYKSLEDIETKQIKTISMGTGNKISRIVAWTFLSSEEQKEWKETRWET